MIRNVIRAAVVLLATLAPPAAILTAPQPAAAAGSHLCESNGQHYCLGTANLNLGTLVTERKPGRVLIAHPLSGTFETHPIFWLEFSAAPGKCVAAQGFMTTDIVVRTCNGGLGVVWARVNVSGGHLRWINREMTQGREQDIYLAGQNVGTSYFVAPLGVSGAFYSFNWQ